MRSSACGASRARPRCVRAKAACRVRSLVLPGLRRRGPRPHSRPRAQIKTAYRQRALECHPDKVADQADAAAKARAETAFKQLGEALEILTDPFKRQLYDEGHDKASIEERVEAARRAAQNHRPHNH